ncbi:hypothetical protein C7121_08965 [Paenibacillus glucanolyticus]|jgi:hypothetical protein|uniref:DUF6042 family protein n=1 Tax=Paenibacillus TaxID=44249 RepID=UPI000D19FC90|nr:DUF6042 family protein [Paenibacillus glucanolyticus]AVV56266.1 hypothetical protein C7121_08965 [Paenibacillus glucanolyticus]
MCSFQNDALNFITNGRVTVRGLSQLGLIPKGQCVIPNGFYEGGWGRWLPMPNITLLPYFSVSVASGFNLAETVVFMKKKVKPNTFINLGDNVVDKRNHEDDEVQSLYERETEIEQKLQANGLLYPKSIVDVIDLYVALGLAFKTEDQQGKWCLDMIIRPLCKIDEVLIN